MTLTYLVVVISAGVIGASQVSTLDTQSTVYVSFNQSAVIRRTSNEFLSIGLDSYILHEKFCGLNFKTAVLLAKALKPAYLRIGGTDADQLIFQPLSITDEDRENKEEECLPPPLQPRNITYKLSGETWNRIYDFASAAGLRIVFDLNVLLREKASNRWNTTNAELFLDYSAARNHAVDVELGNEPNSFYHHFNVSVSPSQLARDFKQLKKLLAKYSLYRNSLIVGPSTTRPSASKLYLKQFLKADDAVSAVSFHHYYMNGKTAVLRDFMDPAILNSYADELNVVVDWVKQFAHPGPKPIWLGETASAWGGGAPNLSDTYAAGFMWLDKLGLSAQLGVDVVVRQSLYFGNYALLNNQSMPNPDFWLSLLYKQIVGQRVLSFTASDAGKTNFDSGRLRFYASCSKINPGKAVLYGMNLLADAVQIHFCDEIAGDAVQRFLLEPNDNLLTSRRVLLNKHELRFDGRRLPRLRSVQTKLPVSVPAKGIIFVELQNEFTQKLCSLSG